MLLLPGTCCHWKINFERHIPLLCQKFYVAAVSYDGFDETEDTIFTDMISETEKIEEYILDHFGGRVFAAYGCSLGGSFVSLLVGRKKIHIDHAIIGSSDMDQVDRITAKTETALIGRIFGPVVQEGRIPGFLKKKIAQQPEEDREYMQLLLSSLSADGKGLPFVKRESICNQFYSDLVTPVGNQIQAEGTVIHVFYALKMGKKYEKRYLQHFASPDIRRYDCQHEELFFRYPEKWYNEILEVCGMS